ncbi:50S ribosomal protein L4 [bacterium]|nr:50S ribosomal protein L4 [bacterium]
MKMPVLGLDSKKAGDIELLDAVFGLTEIRGDLLQRMVRYQLSKRQAGTHSVKSRSNVARTTKKMYRQKGTGGARHGSRNAPIFVGGGVAHGPHPRSHAHDLPKKVRALALRHALSSKVREESLIIIDEAAMAAPKTKDLSSAFKKLGLENALVIGGVELNENFARAARNIPNIDVLPLAGLNVYDVLRRRKLVLTREAVEGVHARFSADAKDGQVSGAKAGEPGFVDDVVLIDGVGEQSAKQLAAEGFAKLTALASLSDADAAAMFARAGYADKAAREEWLAQARDLVAGGAPRAKVDQRLLRQMREQQMRGA